MNPTAAAESRATDQLENLLSLDTLQIELGYGLVSLADSKKGGDLLERVTGVRRNFAQDMGMLIPPIRLRDNLQLGTNEYRFLIKGNPIAQGQLMPGHWLAMNATNSKTSLKGIPTVEPVFQLPVDIEEMGESAGVMIRTSIQALLEADARMADIVLSMDDAVDEANKAVQAELMEVMQQKPEVSTQAITAILIARNLERAADHATNIAEDVIFWLRGSDVRHKFSLAEAE